MSGKDLVGRFGMDEYPLPIRLAPYSIAGGGGGGAGAVWKFVFENWRVGQMSPCLWQTQRHASLNAARFEGANLIQSSNNYDVNQWERLERKR